MKIKLKKGLTFNKEVISKLNEDQLAILQLLLMNNIRT
jgi:hypothetical protein